MSPFPIFLLSSSLSLSYHWKSQFYPFVKLSSSLKDNSCLLHISSVGKESTFNAGGPGLIPGPGRSAGEGKDYPLQYTGLENSMDCIEDPLEKSAHSSILGLPLWLSWSRICLQCGRRGLIPGLGRSPGEGKVYPFQYSGLENSMDCIAHGVTDSDMTERLSLL